MIATGTDVKPLEVLLFMRDVKSVNYFEQMKGRGTRTISKDALQLVSKTAKAKTHFIIVDAVGVTKSKKTDSRPLERKPTVGLKDLLGAVTKGCPVNLAIYSATFTSYPRGVFKPVPTAVPPKAISDKCGNVFFTAFKP